MRMILSALLAATLAALPARGFDTAAEAAFVIDHGTGAVLLAKDADTPRPPASMSKLMTLLMMFEAIEDGRLGLDDRFPVSARAQAMGGSTMWLDTTDRVRVEDLILGIIVQSGNDACVVAAEALSGSEEAFAAQMTRRARELGMTASTFLNSSGWPEPGHEMSARDLVTLATILIDRFPQYYPYFAYEEFAFDGRVPSNHGNRNPILGQGIGADGLKTGHTQEAGFGLVGSAIRDGRRVTFMITGLETAQERATEAERIVNWAFREFETRALYAAGETVAEAEVWLGAEDRVAMSVAEDVALTVPVTGAEVEAHVRYSGPVPAPIAAGQEVAELVLTVEGMAPITVPLIASAEVAEGGPLTRIGGAFGTIGRWVWAQVAPSLGLGSEDAPGATAAG
ncbi:MAG: D-alanyl-D-alanine carboxypeptidase family protein [Pseudomonadota bacterium]